MFAALMGFIIGDRKLCRRGETRRASAVFPSPRRESPSPRLHPISGLPEFGRSYSGRNRIHPISAERSTEAQRGRVRGALRESKSLSQPLTPTLSVEVGCIRLRPLD